MKKTNQESRKVESFRPLLPDEIDRKVVALRELLKSAELLSITSEDFRVAIDDYEARLSAVIQIGIDLPKRERISDRLEYIRRARNGMECFHLKCLTVESVEAAYRDLPA